MATHHTLRLAPVTARDGLDTRTKDLSVACDETQELALVCEDCDECLAEYSLIGMSGREFRLCRACYEVVFMAMGDRAYSEYDFTPEEEDCDPGEMDDDYPAEEEIPLRDEEDEPDPWEYRY